MKLFLKKKVCVALISLLSMGIVSCVNVPVNEPTTTRFNEVIHMSVKNKLIVFGKEISGVEHMVFHENSYIVELPFIAVMEAFGAEIKQESELIFVLTFDGIRYVLDKEHATLTQEGLNKNYIIATPGEKVHHRIVQGEFFLDWLTLRNVMMIMGQTVSADIDYENHNVVIY